MASCFTCANFIALTGLIKVTKSASNSCLKISDEINNDFTSLSYIQISNNKLHASVHCILARGGRLLVSCVPMREQKTMRKGTFFELGSAQRCRHLG